jgi:hypothetical protein
MRKFTPDQLLANQVEQVYRQFMHMPSDSAYVVSTLWAMHTHLRDHEGQLRPRVTPRLYFGSKQPGAGKSLATELTIALSFNGQMIGDPSPPSIVAMMNEDHSTLGFDEIDTHFGRGAASKLRMKGILNMGYRRGGAKVTHVRGGVAERLDPFGPMVLNGKNASVWFLPDGPFDTLRSRSISIILEPKPRDVQLTRFNPELHEDRIMALRDRLTRWGGNAASSILSIPIDGLMPEDIANRAEEIWTVLFRIANYLGDTWPARVEKAAFSLALGKWSADDEPVLDPFEELLANVQATFTDDDDFLSTGEILVRLEALPQRTSIMDEWQSDRAAEMGLANGLAVFEVHTERHMLNGVQVRGYSRDAVGLDPPPLAA